MDKEHAMPAATKQLQLIHQQLLQAARQQDWTALRVLDKQLMQLVKQLEQQGVKDRYQNQLAILKQSYQQIITVAQQALQQTGAEMQQFNQQKAGIVAYLETTEARS